MDKFFFFFTKYFQYSQPRIFKTFFLLRRIPYHTQIHLMCSLEELVTSETLFLLPLLLNRINSHLISGILVLKVYFPIFYWNLWGLLLVKPTRLKLLTRLSVGVRQLREHIFEDNFNGRLNSLWSKIIRQWNITKI